MPAMNPTVSQIVDLIAETKNKLRGNPIDVEAWIALYDLLSDPQQKEDCLKWAVKTAPNHPGVKNRMADQGFACKLPQGEVLEELVPIAEIQSVPQRSERVNPDLSGNIAGKSGLSGMEAPGWVQQLAEEKVRRHSPPRVPAAWIASLEADFVETAPAPVAVHCPKLASAVTTVPVSAPVTPTKLKPPVWIAALAGDHAEGQTRAVREPEPAPVAIEMPEPAEQTAVVIKKPPAWITALAENPGEGKNLDSEPIHTEAAPIRSEPVTMPVKRPPAWILELAAELPESQPNLNPKPALLAPVPELPETVAIPLKQPPAWIAALAENQNETHGEEIPLVETAHPLEPELRSATVPLPEPVLAKNEIIPLPTARLIEIPAAQRPANPITDQQTVDIHYSWGSVNKKAISAAIGDYTGHGYLLTYAFPKSAPTAEKAAAYLVMRGHSEMLLTTRLSFEKIDPAAKSLRHAYPYELTFEAEGRKDPEIRFTLNSLSGGDPLGVSIPKKGEEGADWMLVRNQATNRVVFRSKVVQKVKDRLTIEIYRGDTGIQLGILFREKYFLDFKFRLENLSGVTVFSMTKSDGTGYFMQSADQRAEIRVTATGFGWYLFRPGDPYRKSDTDEEFYLAGALAI
jgi:hypothetical protein